MFVDFREIKREIYRSALAPLPFDLRIKLDYLRRHRAWPNTQRPELHSEKMVRRILRETSFVFTQLCSKRQMKTIAEAAVPEGQMAIADTIWFGRSADVLDAVKDAARLETPWVLKPNNLGGGIIMFQDPEWNTNDLERHTLGLLRQARRTEMAYRRHAPIAWRSSEPGFIIERRIGRTKSPTDYKVHVFNGKPSILSIYKDRGSSLSVQHFDIRGKYLFGRNDAGLNYWPGQEEIESLLACASALSCDLQYARIDFYLDDGCLWFGEISPYGSMDGLAEHPKLDQEMGMLWEI